jgi:hypothetical protein
MNHDWPEFTSFVVTQLQEIRVELAEIKSKDRFLSSVFGFLAGCIPTIIMIVWDIVKR